MNQVNKFDTFVIVLHNNDHDEKNGEFEITFNKPIHIREDMEVALTQITMPKNIWTNNSLEIYSITLNVHLPAIISDTPIMFEGIDHLELKEPEQPYFFSNTFNFTAINIIEFFRYYESIKSRIKLFISFNILKRYNKYRLDDNDYPEIKIVNGFLHNKIGYSQFKRKSPSDEYVNFAYSYFNFSKNLHKIFGYNIDKFPNVIYDENTKIATNEPEAINKVEFKNIVDILFVYSDIVKETYVGNTKTNILRVFPVNNIDKNKIISYNFEHLFYIPLRVNEIISIKISIRDSLSNILLYDEGDISITLLFRPKEHI